MTTLLCWCHSGDSIGASGNTWPFQALGVSSRGDSSSKDAQAAAVYRVGDILLKNMAVSGTKLTGVSGSDIVQLAPSYIDTIPARKSFAGGRTRKFLFTTSIGSNDSAVGGLASPAAYAAAVASACRDRKSAGYDYAWMGTLTPRGSIPEPDRLAYNALLADSAWRLANGIDDYIDLTSAAHAQPQYLPINNGGDTTWFDEFSIHPSTALQAEMAAIALAKITAFQATLG